jgi:hypothetical protein
MNLASQEDRVKLINSINSQNNKERKQISLRQFEIQSGRIKQYVREDLLSQYSHQTVKETPIVSSINVQKRIVEKKSTVYKAGVNRSFTMLNDNQIAAMNLIYRDMCADSKLNQMNKGFNYQDQSIGMILPKNGKLQMRIFKMHQIDVIPSDNDPETAMGYIISAFDRQDFLATSSELKETATGVSPKSLTATSSQSSQEEIAEQNQYKKYVEKYIVWTNEFNFMMNGLGEVISENVDSPLASEGIMPFFEISREKDFEFFARSSNSLTDFTIQFNSILSDLANNIKLNGYSVGVLKAPAALQPQHHVIGAAMLLKLPTDNTENGQVDFDFASPNSSIGEISAAIKDLLGYFVSSEGLDSDAISSNGESNKATSGFDRFLQAIQKIEAHKDDYEAFKRVEDQVYSIIKAWLNVLNGTNQLERKYQAPSISSESEVIVKYVEPKMIQTETEKLASIEKKMELELMSESEAIMELREIKDEDEAEKILAKIKEEIYGKTSRENQNFTERNESGDQP